MKNLYLKASIVASSLMTVAAFADDTSTDTVNTQAQAAFSALSSQANSYASYAWPVVITITGALIAIKLFKKFVNRAS